MKKNVLHGKSNIFDGIQFPPAQDKINRLPNTSIDINLVLSHSLVTN